MIASLPTAERHAFLSQLDGVEFEALQYEWEFWARPNQLPPDGNWLVWLLLGGRGTGKTRTGAEWVRANVCGKTPLAPGKYRHIAIVGETAADVRDIMLGEGRDADQASGLFQVHPKDFRPSYEVTKRRIVWPNGAIATLYNATEPDQLRGPAHGAAWCDELAKWHYGQDTWDNLEFGLRQGSQPRVVVTTTPKPTKIMRQLISDPRTVVTRGSTYENYANLSERFIERIRRKYEGTRLGRQELHAEILDDVPNALWTRDLIEKAHVRERPKDLYRIVIGVDPSGAAGKDPTIQSKRDKERAAIEDDGAGNAIGIVVVGLDARNVCYVLADRTLVAGPSEWAKEVITAYHDFQADLIVAERNYGGAMVESTIRSVDRFAAVKMVVASRGKHIRAEPVASLYEQGRVKHVGGFPDLEDQMASIGRDGTYVGGGSPDRLDAMVWAVHELLLQDEEGYVSDMSWV